MRTHFHGCKPCRPDWGDVDHITADVTAAKEVHYEQLTAAGISAMPGEQLLCFLTALACRAPCRYRRAHACSAAFAISATT